MTDWKQASIEWSRFLADILQARGQVGCQHRSAWFRGLKDEKYDLVPTLLRADVESVGQNLKKVTNKDIYDLLAMDRAARSDILLQWSSARTTAQFKHAIMEQIDKASKFEGQYKHREKNVDEAEVLVIVNGFSYILQEIDAFHEFKNRSRMGESGSWLILASMRHHEVPVRLLDWTESFVVALYFALEKYMEKFIGEWSASTKWQKNDLPPFPKMRDIESLKQPAFWIINPFHLAQLSNIHGSIPYPDLGRLPDYYDCLLIKKNWPYKRPIPIHADKSSQRIESQRGHFTVHGYYPEPLNLQIFGNHDQKNISKEKRSTVLSKVKLSKNAAAYGAFFLWQFVNFDHFELFRDLDSLGKVVRGRHLPMH
jgi:hypothetical protein